MFHFTPLLGAQSDSQACQSLLELDNGIKILIDVGWDEDFDVGMLAELERHTPTIDLILLTHPTLSHLGAYAHACKHIPTFSSIPVYSTFPVSNLGRLLLQDLYISSPIASTRLLSAAVSTNNPTSPFPAPKFLPGVGGDTTSSDLPQDALKLPPTPSEIDSYCTKINTLKYSQPTPLHSAAARVSGKLSSITITAYSAGHTLGGTIWKIQQAQESIVYAVDWNHSRENCLRGAAFLSGGSVSAETLGRPTALVCSAKNSEVVNIAGGRKKRDELLLEAIRKTAVERGGTVLIPSDSVGRVLELAYLLEHAWRRDGELSGKGKGRKGVGLFLAGRRVKRLGQVVGSMLEWMDEGVVREFEAIAGGEKNNHNRNNRRGGGGGGGGGDGPGDTGNKAGPFDFQHLKLVSTPNQLMRILNDHSEGGKVIVASDASLEWGFSRDALIRLAGDEKNLVVLTERKEGKLGWAGSLWQGWKDGMEDRKDIDEKLGNAGREVGLNGENELEIPHRTPLKGEELVSYQKHLAAQQALTSQQQSLLSSSGLPSAIGVDQDDDDASDSSSDDDSDSERQGKALTTANSKKVSAATVMLGGTTPAVFGAAVGAGKVDIGVSILLRGKGVFDYDVRGAKGRNRMFPFVMRRRRIDEYGEIVRGEEYIRAEEKEEEDLADERDAASGEPGEEGRVMGKKRKWDEAEIRARQRRGSKAAGAGDRRKIAKNGRNFKSIGRQDRDRKDGYEPQDNEEEEGEVLSESEDAEDEEEILATPSKLTKSTVKIEIRVRVAFIDFSGLHDSRSLRMLLPLINPRKLILIGGRPNETKSLATDCRDLLSGRGPGRGGIGASAGGVEVFFPEAGRKVNASVDTNAWIVKLSDSLSRGLKWQNVRGLGVVHVIGRIVRGSEYQLQQQQQQQQQQNEDTHQGKKQKLIIKSDDAPSEEANTEESNKSDNTTLILDLLPPAVAAATRSVAQPIHVGDIRLADLRRVMQEQGHAAEFRGEGTLLIDGVVAVRKGGVGNVIIEDGGGGLFSGGRGRSGGSFGEVRRRVYEGLAVVSGG